jgi:tripartite-type tricarboxylate transporter receptor subunit TctC
MPNLPNRIRSMTSALAIGALALALPLSGVQAADTDSARTSAWPTSPMRVIVPYAAGGFSDISSRFLAERVSRVLGQPWVLESRPGGGGRIGADLIAKAPADGYHLLYTTNGTHTYMAVTEKNLSYDPIRDFTPISLVGVYGLQMVVHPSVPATSIAEFIDYARRNPGRINYATSGTGSGVHFAGELMKMLGRIDMVHVPYKGTAPAMQDVIAGVCQVSYDGAAKPFIDAGKVRFLGTTSRTRDPRYPSVPTIAEGGLPGFDLTYWIGVFGPPGLPPSIQMKLNAAINTVIADEDFKAKYASLGITTVGGSPDAVPAQIRTETATLRRIAADANLKFD